MKLFVNLSGLPRPPMPPMMGMEGHQMPPRFAPPPPQPPQPPQMEDEPPSKKAKTEDSLVHEQEWLRRNGKVLCSIYVTKIFVKYMLCQTPTAGASLWQ